MLSFLKVARITTFHLWLVSISNGPRLRVFKLISEVIGRFVLVIDELALDVIASGQVWIATERSSAASTCVYSCPRWLHVSEYVSFFILTVIKALSNDPSRIKFWLCCCNSFLLVAISDSEVDLLKNLVFNLTNLFSSLESSVLERISELLVGVLFDQFLRQLWVSGHDVPDSVNCGELGDRAGLEVSGVWPVSGH